MKDELWELLEQCKQNAQEFKMLDDDGWVDAINISDLEDVFEKFGEKNGNKI